MPYRQTPYGLLPQPDDQLYVCPRTGLLKRARRRNRIAQVDDRTVWKISRERELRRIGSAWYEVRFVRVPLVLKRTWSAFDIVLEHELTAGNVHKVLRRAYGRDDHYAFSKRPVTKRGLRDLFAEAQRFRQPRVGGIPWDIIKRIVGAA